MNTLKQFAVLLSLLVTSAGQQLCLAQTVGPIPAMPEKGSGPQNLSAWLQYVALELKNLRLELIEERREKQQAGLAALERELQLIRDQQKDLDEQQNAESREPMEIDVQLTQPDLSKARREELEARKADLLVAGPSRFASPQSALARREADARERIALQQQRLQLLAQEAQNLAPPAK